MSKSARNKRLRAFEENVLEGLRMVYRVEKRGNGGFSIHTRDFGVIDIYPKSDKLLFREDNNKWIGGGIEWVCNNL